MTDREMLELAAQAAGMPIHVWGTKGKESVADMTTPSNPKPWNPLLDDGDAFRLQVKLRFTVKIADHECEVFDEVSGECLASIPMFNASDEEARKIVRRAITMAAAEIGKAKEG